jgi:hypothetical protein
MAYVYQGIWKETEVAVKTTRGLAGLSLAKPAGKFQQASEDGVSTSESGGQCQDSCASLGKHAGLVGKFLCRQTSRSLGLLSAPLSLDPCGQAAVVQDNELYRLSCEVSQSPEPIACSPCGQTAIGQDDELYRLSCWGSQSSEPTALGPCGQAAVRQDDELYRLNGWRSQSSESTALGPSGQAAIGQDDELYCLTC